MTPSVAFITVSYAPDRDRCALLSRSLEVFAPSVEHWIVVDRADLPLFRSLSNSRTTLVTTEDVLPVWLRRLDLRRIGLRSNPWVQARGRPVRGWLVQQLVKLAVARELRAEVLVHVDSDVVLMRPFDISSLSDHEGRVRMYAKPDTIDDALPSHVRWHRSAERLLGLAQAQTPLPDLITSFVPWRRANAVTLLDHIERTTGRHWLRALAAAWDVSEYILYGRFVLDVLRETSGQYMSASSLCRDYWGPAPLPPRELEAFLDRLGPEEVAAMISAKAGMRPGDYADALERRWAGLEKSDSYTRT